MEKVKELVALIGTKKDEIEGLKDHIKKILLDASDWKVGDILFSYTDDDGYRAGTKIISDVGYDFNKDEVLYIASALSDKFCLGMPMTYTFNELKELGYDKIGECEFVKGGYITRINLQHTFENRSYEEELCDVDETEYHDDLYGNNNYKYFRGR